MKERNVCEFCGNKLEPIIVNIFGRNQHVGWKDCGCDKEKAFYEQQEQLQEEYNARRRAERLEYEIERARIPKRYRSATLDDASLYETAFQHGLYMFGDVGTGKTTKACAIGIRAAESGKRVLFVKAYEIADLMKDESSRIANADLLIIDDLGAENTSEWNNTRLRAAIDQRYDSMLPIIVTSNYSKEQLKNLLLRNVKDMTPKAIVSRLSEMTKEIKIEGKDMRL